MNTNQLACEMLNDAVEAINKGWTQQVFARNENGDVVSPDSPAATCYCMAGGIHCGFYKAEKKYRDILGDDELDNAFQLCFKVVKEKMPYGDAVVSFNDCSVTTQADVLKVLTDAKASLENANGN